MSRAEIVNAVIAKHDAPTGADSAPDAPGAPPAGAPGAESAPADAEAPYGASTPADGPGGAPASPGATVDHDVLRARLEADRARRRAKAERKQAQADREAAEAARKEAEKWKGLPWKERAIADGKDPLEVFREMQEEARKAATPEAREAALTKAFEAKLAAFENEKLSPLQKTVEEITRERDELRKQNTEMSIAGDFRDAASQDVFAPLLEEYEPQQLYQIARGLYDNPERARQAATNLRVPLTSGDGAVTMLDVFHVMRATQAAHQARMQRRNQSAAPHTSQAGQQQPPQAKPPVNGTVERNAGTPTTIGNDLAASSASDAQELERLKGMTRGQRVAYVAKKYG